MRPSWVLRRRLCLARASNLAFWLVASLWLLAMLVSMAFGYVQDYGFWLCAKSWLFDMRWRAHALECVAFKTICILKKTRMKSPCGICLMLDGDLWQTAPCGFAGARFHVACIAKMVSLRRCPHCNVAIGAKREIECLAEACMSRGGFWDDAVGSFVEFQRGSIQYGICEQTTLTNIVAIVLGVMMKKKCCVRVSQSDEATRCFSCDDTSASRFVVTLRRTALYGRRGRILSDGYTLLASRRRVSARRLS